MYRAGLAVIVLASLSTAARAGGYLGLGIGTSPAIGGADGDRLEADGRSGRLLVGTRFNQISIEGSVGGFDVLSNANGTLIPYGTAYQAAAAVKASLPLGNGFEAFGRFGLHHSWISPERDLKEASGNGYLLGAGFEYKLNLGLSYSALWIDYQFSKATLEGDRLELDVNQRVWTLGFSVGI